MHALKRICSFALTVMMLASVCFSAASCKAEKEAARKVLETDPWYNSKRIELDPGFDPELYSLVLPAGPFLCRDKYVMTYYAWKGDPDGPVKYSTECDLMCIFDQDGKLLNTVDLGEIMSQAPSVYNVFVVQGCRESPDGMRFYFNEAGFLSAYYCDIDLETGIQTGPVQMIDLSIASDADMSGASKDSSYISSSFLIEDYEVFCIGSNSRTKTRLVVTKDAEALYCIDLEKEFGPGEGVATGVVDGTGNGMAIFDCYGKSKIWAKLELATGKITKLEDARPVPSDQTVSSTPDGKGYLTNAAGIYEYDPENGNENCIISFDNCDANRFESQYGGVLYYGEDKVIIGSCSRILELYSLPLPAVIYTLEKAEKNPNAGKTIVTVASLSDSLTHPEAEALKIFNEKNQEFFAKLKLYDKGNYPSENDYAPDIDNSDIQRYSAMALVSGTLTSDIRSGMGPDVVLGASGSVDLLDSAYLMDLTPYLNGGSFDPSAYYSKIIGAADMEGKTFFIPTAFTVAGIVTDGTRTAKEQTGFTYDEYASFVREKLNGTEPVTGSSSRMHFLNLCIQRNYTDWLENGKLDFDCRGFRELSEFFKENIPEGITCIPDEEKFWTEEYYQPPKKKDAVFVEDINGLPSLAGINFYGKNLKVMGLPSPDGKGLTANITNSFSITEGTPVPEGAFAFLDILLSEDVQKNFRDAIPVNRAAVMQKLEREKRDNLIGFTRAGKLSRDELGSPLDDSLREGKLFDPSTKLDEIFLDMLEKVDSVMIPDNSVLMIVSEEMPPYLAGQKDLSSVISAVNNRTKTVFDER